MITLSFNHKGNLHLCFVSDGVIKFSVVSAPKGLSHTVETTAGPRGRPRRYRRRRRRRRATEDRTRTEDRHASRSGGLTLRRLRRIPRLYLITNRIRLGQAVPCHSLLRLCPTTGPAGSRSLCGWCTPSNLGTPSLCTLSSR